MAACGDGALIITGTTASLRGKPFTTAFAPGKAAQRSLAQSLARQYGKHGVHVALIIVDGIVDEPKTRERMPDTPPEAFVCPEGYADAISFLLRRKRAMVSRHHLQCACRQTGPEAVLMLFVAEGGGPCRSIL